MTGQVLDLQSHRKKEAERLREYRRRTGKVRTEEGFTNTCWVCGDSFKSHDRSVRVCGDGGCKKEQQGKRRQPQPFTVEHFERWARGVILDTGKPWKVEPFQAEFLADLFSGIPECWLLIPEGNTKTTTLGGVALYHCQHRRNARVPVAAASRDQAMEMWLQIDGMVQESDMLRPLFQCQEGNRRIKCPSMNSRIQVLAADERTNDGAIFTLALLDELHRHRDLRLYRLWSGKRGKRGGQIVAISTAGEPGSEFENTRATIRTSAKERDDSRPGFVRSVAGPVVMHEYAVPEDGDTEDMKTVKLANPFSGVTLKSLREKRKSPTMNLPHWRRLTCNLATRGFAAAITESEWFGQKTDIEIPVGAPVWAGLDVAWKWDTTALVPLWVRDPEFRLLGEATILEPPRDGTSLDPDEVEEALTALHDRNPIHTLVMDTTSAMQLASWAAEHLGCEVIDRGQSNALQALDYQYFMEALREKWLFHTGHEELQQHALNAAVQTLPSEKAKFARPKSSRGKDQEVRVIDALVAAAMAHSVMAAELAEPDEGEKRPMVMYG